MKLKPTVANIEHDGHPGMRHPDPCTWGDTLRMGGTRGYLWGYNVGRMGLADHIVDGPC